MNRRRPPRLAALLGATAAAAALFGAAPAARAMPEGFVPAAEHVAGLREEIRYAGSDNFVGRPIDGYAAPRCILSRPAADALALAQRRAQGFGLTFKAYDCYRPQRAVAHFVRWARDVNDTLRRADYYPDVDKSRLFEEGYIAERSGHSRGSTIDLTLVDAATGAELDMGTGFDRFSPSSWPDAPGMTAQQRANRMLLQILMVAAGFRPYPQEWWHFTLDAEPYPDTYFDFVVQ